MRIRLAVVVSHPIQYLAPWHRELAGLLEVELRVHFCCDWGLKAYTDPEFTTTVKWDVPLLDGYDHSFLPIGRRPRRLGFWEVDNPRIANVLDTYNPDVVQVFGYAHRTNWRAAYWAHKRRKPLMLISDSNAGEPRSFWKIIAKRLIVGHFYRRVDGAFYIGENNYKYHRQYGLPADRLFQGLLPIDRLRLLNAISDPAASRRRLRERLCIPRNAFLAMLSGKYISRKRPLDLIKACWTASRRGLPIWCLLVGEGPERAAMESFCRDQGVTNAVLAGFVNQAAIPEYYAASDVLAVTSSRDAHPLVVSEGASFGLPVIISNKVGCIGPNDFAQPGVNSIVYSCGDVNQLRIAIERLYEDKALYNEMSAASRRISEKQDASAAARELVVAVKKLYDLGPR